MIVLCRTTRYPDLTMNKEYFAEWSEVFHGEFQIINDEGCMGDYDVADFEIISENLPEASRKNLTLPPFVVQ